MTTVGIGSGVWLGASDFPFSKIMRTNNLTLAGAMDILAREIHCEDGVATAAIAEAAARIRELAATLDEKDRQIDVITRKWQADQHLMRGCFQLLKDAGAMPDSTQLIEAANRFDAASSPNI